MSFRADRFRTRRAGLLIQRLEARQYMSALPASALALNDNPLHEIGLPPVAAPASNDPTAQVAAGPLFPLSSIPTFNSDPGAVATLYLDFHGEPAQAWGAQTVPATPAYT